jgi:hypothetical protein
VTPDITGERYFLDPGRTGLAAYRLLTHILASQELSKLCTGHFACGYDILRDNFEKQEIQHLLIELAITFRVNEESVTTRATHGLETPAVGWLWEPIGRDNWTFAFLTPGIGLS